jgi:hypothetical protein
MQSGVIMKWYDNEHTILQVISSAHWSWAWLHQYSREHIVPQLRGQKQPVALIVDMRNSPYFPASELVENVRTQIDIYSNSTLDITVIVTSYPWLARLLENTYRRYGLPTRFYYGVTSLEEAIERIQETREGEKL